MREERGDRDEVVRCEMARETHFGSFQFTIS